jgi:hypothetical protein
MVALLAQTMLDRGVDLVFLMAPAKPKPRYAASASPKSVKCSTSRFRW